MTIACRSLGLMACVLACACGEVSPQLPASGPAVSEDLLCPDCELHFHQVALLGRETDPVGFRENGQRACMVSRSGSGQYLVTTLVGGGSVAVYDEAGRYVREFSRLGEGPGELGPSNNRIALLSGDTVVVLDEAQKRIQVFGPDGQFLRGFRTDARRLVTPLVGGGIAITRKPTDLDDPVVQFLTAGGEVRTGFGTTRWRPSDIDLTEWLITSDRRGGVWTASSWEYALTRWDSDGNRVADFVRSAPWFPVQTEFPPGAYITEPPPSLLTHIWEDERGLLWVFLQIPDEDWNPEVGDRVNPDWYRDTWDTVVEVIDPEARQLVATGRFPAAVGRTCDSGLVFQITYAGADTRVSVLEPVFLNAAGDTLLRAAR